MKQIKGEATVKGTEKRTESFKEIGSCKLGRTGFLVSKAGFGCYRVRDNTKAHYNSLYKSVIEGINLIDTSTTYTGGESEQVVGKVVKDLIDGNKIKREEIVIVSKIGYVHSDSMNYVRERLKENNPIPDMVHYNEHFWHCIHPEFIEEQLTRSLKRLNIEKLDIFLLHNPEYFLSLASEKGEDKEKAQEEYYSRIAKAFIQLEKEVEKGRIGWYGISSNTFPVSHKEFSHTSLEKVWEIAEKISPEHHFGVIQFPANLYEDGAIFNKNQIKNNKTLLELIKELKVGVLINRPLNAIVNNSLIRLSNHNKDLKSEIHKKLNEFLPENIKESSLSQKAIWMLLSLPEIDNVLVGMRKEEYVDDVIESLKLTDSDKGLNFWNEWKEKI